jgi:thioredoxin 1
MNRIFKIMIIVLIMVAVGLTMLLKFRTKKDRKKDIKVNQSIQVIGEIKATFIELGSVKCIPCKMMQPIIKEIKEKYSDQVKVIFYDIWTRQGRPYAKQYNIKMIPTQVFLDKDGKEYFRHEGFFPKEEILKVLKMQGIE